MIAMMAAMDAPMTKKNGLVRLKMILETMMRIMRVMMAAIEIMFAVLSSIDEQDVTALNYSSVQKSKLIMF